MRHSCAHDQGSLERAKCDVQSDGFRWLYASAMWAALLLACAPSVAQSGVGGLSNLPTAEQVINRNDDPYLGSIPQGHATADILELTINDALDKGLKYNLGLYLAARATEQASAARLRALSDLLPVVNGSFSEEDQKLNLKQFGFSFPGFPSSVGPFGLSDLRATGAWTVLDFHSINNIQAASQTLKATQFTYRDARDTVVLAVGANYLLTIAQESRVTATEAEFKTAQALYQLAEDQETAGLAPQIDTLRARVQLQAQQEALIQAQNDLQKQRIALARSLGCPCSKSSVWSIAFPTIRCRKLSWTAPTSERCKLVLIIKQRWLPCVRRSLAAKRHGSSACRRSVWQVSTACWERLPTRWRRTGRLQPR